jgi:hypothetical protein
MYSTCGPVSIDPGAVYFGAASHHQVASFAQKTRRAAFDSATRSVDPACHEWYHDVTPHSLGPPDFRSRQKVLR